MSAGLKRSLDRLSEKTSQVQGGAPMRANMPVWTFYLETGTSRFLPLLGGFNQITFSDGPQDTAFSGELGLVMLRKMPAKMFAYRVEGMQTGATLRLPVEGAEADANDPKRPVFTDIDSLKPEETARLAAAVAEIGAPPDNPGEFARRACEWLAQRHAYSLQSHISPGDTDPLVFWIGTKEPGHCELFAGAFALLARKAGYPSRVVLGFSGGSWNPHSENLTVRNSDAHAWCEIFDRAAGAWTRVDPTPGVAAPGGSANGPQGEAAIARIQDRRCHRCRGTSYSRTR